MPAPSEPSGEFEKWPRWRHALDVLLERGLPYGSRIERDEIVRLLKLKQPVTAAQQQAFQLEYLEQFHALRYELLEGHCLLLRTVHGERCYEVTPPNRQTDVALAVGVREIKSALVKASKGVTFIRSNELSAEEARKNADAQARLASLAVMVRGRRLGGPRSQPP